MAQLLFNRSYNVAIAEAIKNQDLYLGWGGKADGLFWENTPPNIDPNLTTLPNEICRRKILKKSYIVEDSANGTITAGDRKWSKSDTPTKNLLLEVTHSQEDVPTATIYSIGVYVGTKIKSTSSRVDFLLPQDLENPGSLLVSQYIVPIIRNAATSESRQIVVCF